MPWYLCPQAKNRVLRLYETSSAWTIKRCL
jgi:hypothetical protein